MGSSDCAPALWCRNTFGHFVGHSVTSLLRPIGAVGSSNCTAILGRRTFMFSIPTFLSYRRTWGANPCASASVSGGARGP